MRAKGTRPRSAHQGLAQPVAGALRRFLEAGTKWRIRTCHGSAAHAQAATISTLCSGTVTLAVHADAGSQAGSARATAAQGKAAYPWLAQHALEHIEQPAADQCAHEVAVLCRADLHLIPVLQHSHAWCQNTCEQWGVCAVSRVCFDAPGAPVCPVSPGRLQAPWRLNASAGCLVQRMGV